MTRMLKIFLIFALAGGLSAGFVRSQTAAPERKPVRRALLVGISEYNKLETNRSFTDLSSVKNDIRAMETLLASPNYGFEIRKLKDEEATRENIFKEIRKFLIEEAAPGDVSLFYFSGHGSQIKNTLGGESDLVDETFVPYDVIRPVEKPSDLRDIRDKEINALLKEATDKNIRIIFIADSCHSGSIGRDDEEIRRIEPAEVGFCKSADSKEIDLCQRADRRELDKPFQKGAMVISAARDFQQAAPGDYSQDEIPGLEKNYLGNFTANLLLTLYETPADLVSAEDLFTRVAARMRGRGLKRV